MLERLLQSLFGRTRGLRSWDVTPSGHAYQPQYDKCFDLAPVGNTVIIYPQDSLHKLT